MAGATRELGTVSTLDGCPDVELGRSVVELGLSQPDLQDAVVMVVWARTPGGYFLADELECGYDDDYHW